MKRKPSESLIRELAPHCGLRTLPQSEIEEGGIRLPPKLKFRLIIPHIDQGRTTASRSQIMLIDNVDINLFALSVKKQKPQLL